MWTWLPAQSGVANMSNAGRLDGLRGMSQGLGLDIKPYIVGNLSRAGPWRTRTAGDRRCGHRCAGQRDAGVMGHVERQPDFAETEVDDRR